LVVAMPRLWFPLLPFALAVGLACGRSPPADPVILELSGQAVHRSDFDRHVQALEARGGSVEPKVRAALIDPFLEEQVLVLEARSRGLLKPGDSAEDQEAAVRKLLSDEVLSRVQVSDEEVAAYYAAHAGDFTVPETVVLRQILVPTENEARDVRRRLSKVPRSFEGLAQSRSRAPEASKGGLMGAFSRGELPPELEVAAFALSPGGTSEVLSTPLGYHVLHVDAREPSRERALEECRAEIRTLLTRQKSDQATRQFVRELLSRAKVNHEATQPVRPS
jgi:parvulin-like peptidyl-prolyl isomerase